ncbi:hypothetical protein [Streptomyces sp. SID13031]|uniref:hypothetical protein n=1 Tax=Streptomyces sp. SID13031 TaxID=2706046 RepID=UPI0013C80508|nr:hypothetical protein [Streptomyces sp. SID13031]NEA33973.1 hypothetical protein [Streptomyces sp. SID13031]
MTSDPAGFYGATAQTIPVLLLVLAVETTFLARAAHSETVRRSLEAWAAGGRIFIPLPDGVLGVSILSTVLSPLVAAVVKVLAKPIGRIANAAFVLGTLTLSLATELLAFVGLAITPGPTFVTWSVWITLATIFLLVLETLLALGRVAVVGAYRQSQTAPSEADEDPSSSNRDRF